MTPAERSAIRNAIWLCATCASLIDRDELRFPSELLRQWKEEHEARAAEQIGRTAAEQEGVDVEIDAAASLYREKKTAAGIDRLEGLRRWKWNRLSPRQRYRVLANLGNGHLLDDEPAKAAVLFTEAAYHQPDDPDAQAFLAHALEISGDRTAAYSLSKELVTTKRCKRAAATYIRCAPPEDSIETLAAATKAWHSELETAIPLAVRAINDRSFDVAINLAESLATKCPNLPAGPLLHGKAIYIRQASELQSRESKIDIAELIRANTLLTEAYDRATRASLPDEAADALLARHHLKLLMGKDTDARRDLEEAARLAPKNVQVLVARALSIRSEDRQFAIELLRDAVAAGADSRAQFLLAMLLREKDKDRTEAMEIFHGLAKSLSPLREDALGLAFDLATQLGSQHQVTQLLELAADMDACLHATLLAERALQTTVDSEARVQFDVALKGVDLDKTAASTRRRLADVAMRLGQPEEAIPILKSLVTRGIDSPDLWGLLPVALELGMHELILEHAAALRANGFWLPRYVNLESSLLEKYDPEGAYSLLVEHLERHPDDKLARLRLCTVCLRTGRDGEAVAQPDDLPPATGDLSVAVMVAQVLHATFQHDAALSYSYDVLRAHWDDPDAHLLYFRLHAETSPSVRPERPSAIQIGSAACYKEISRETTKWVVIEDGTTHYPMLGEIRPENPLAQALLGKAPGEVVTLSGGIEPRRVEILRVEHKHVYRWQQCGEEYQLNFPGRSELQSFQIGDDGQPVEERFAAMFKASAVRSAHVTSIMDTYRDELLTLHALSQALGTDTVSCLLGLARDESQFVRAFPNDKTRYDECIQAAFNASRLILAPTCLGTIIALGIESRIATLGWRIQITPGTRDLLKGLIRGRAVAERLPVVQEEGAPTGESIDSRADLSSAARTLMDKCEVIPARSLASMDAKKRDMLVSLHGQAGAETIAASTEDDAVAWSDDLTFLITASIYDGRSVGAQAVITSASRRGLLATAESDELVARLIGFRYQAIWFTESVTKIAARLANYNPLQQPFLRIVELLGHNDATPIHVASSALTCICEVSQNLEIDSSRVAAITKIVTTVGSRQNGRLLVEQILRAIPAKFGLNALRAQEAQEIVRAWLVTVPTS